VASAAPYLPAGHHQNSDISLQYAGSDHYSSTLLEGAYMAAYNHANFLHRFPALD